jgi:hypothetical protein
MSRAAATVNRDVVSGSGPQIDTRGHSGGLEIVRVDLSARIAEFRVRSADGLSFSVTAVPLSMVRPLSEEDTNRFWIMLVDDLFRSLKDAGKYPEFVKGFEVNAGEDSTGDPAVYVRILVDSPRKPANDATVSRWNEFANTVQDALIQLRLQRSPYVQLGEWRRKR